MRHPYGIWNATEREWSLSSLRLWDIPMGFETLKQPKHRKIRWIMRHPYGIWNPCHDKRTTVLRHYETSLWDLKLEDPYTSCILQELWDIPMGFETLLTRASEYALLSLWDIPMGFETQRVLSAGHVWYALWDIPMGFETFILLRHGERPRHYETSLWDLKLFDAFFAKDPIEIMRHPYGIWNAWPQYLQARCQGLWDIPMGFETTWRNQERDHTNHYETSLWDLKLVASGRSDWWVLIMRHPYGIWNSTLCLESKTATTLWDIPMGFETL